MDLDRVRRHGPGQGDASAPAVGPQRARHAKRVQQFAALRPREVEEVPGEVEGEPVPLHRSARAARSLTSLEDLRDHSAPPQVVGGRQAGEAGPEHDHAPHGRVSILTRASTTSSSTKPSAVPAEGPETRPATARAQRCPPRPSRRRRQRPKTALTVRRTLPPSARCRRSGKWSGLPCQNGLPARARSTLTYAVSASGTARMASGARNPAGLLSLQRIASASAPRVIPTAREPASPR